MGKGGKRERPTEYTISQKAHPDEDGAEVGLRSIDLRTYRSRPKARARAVRGGGVKRHSGDDCVRAGEVPRVLAPEKRHSTAVGHLNDVVREVLAHEGTVAGCIRWATKKEKRKEKEEKKCGSNDGDGDDEREKRTRKYLRNEKGVTWHVLEKAAPSCFARRGIVARNRCTTCVSICCECRKIPDFPLPYATGPKTAMGGDSYAR